MCIHIYIYIKTADLQLQLYHHEHKIYNLYFLLYFRNKGKQEIKLQQIVGENLIKITTHRRKDRIKCMTRREEMRELQRKYRVLKGKRESDDICD